MQQKKSLKSHIYTAASCFFSSHNFQSRMRANTVREVSVVAWCSSLLPVQRISFLILLSWLVNGCDSVTDF